MQIQTRLPDIPQLQSLRRPLLLQGTHYPGLNSLALNLAPWREACALCPLLPALLCVRVIPVLCTVSLCSCPRVTTFLLLIPSALGGHWAVSGHWKCAAVTSHGSVPLGEHVLIAV